jgi:hypothetical protein
MRLIFFQPRILFFLQIKVIPFKIVPLGSYIATEEFFPIVGSSAGMLLLEYLSAHRLRSFGYYPNQNGALSSGF